MATQAARTRSRERLEALAVSRVGGEELQREVVQELRRVIGFDRWCWPMADPTSVLPGPGLAEHNYGPQLPRALECEYAGGEFATKEQSARGSSPALSLSRSTGADLVRSSRWDQVLRGAGIGDLALLACRDRFGCWAWLELYRDSQDRPFSGLDLALLNQLGPVLARALRTQATAGTVNATGSPDSAGVLLLDDHSRPVGQTASATAWFSLLPAALFQSWGMFPPAVYAAAVLARSGRETEAHLLSRSATGGWVRLEASGLEDAGEGAVAVTIRTATQQEIFDLAARAHGLTVRERQVTAAVVRGQDTDDIARTLVMSPWTVQDHLKSVFAKVGVHRRGEIRARFGG